MNSPAKLPITPEQKTASVSGALDKRIDAANDPKGVAVKPLSKFDTFRNLIDKYKADFNLLIPKHMDPEKVFRLALSAVRRNPKLLECDQLTVIGAMLEATSCGLEVNTPMKEAYLVPFMNNRRAGVLEAQLIVGYRGFIKMFLNSPKGVTLFGAAVREKDVFDYAYGTSSFLLHKPPMGADDRGDIIAFYACAEMLNHGKVFIVMSLKDVHHVRDTYSSGYKSAHDKGKDDESPWVSNFEDMGIKTCIRALEPFIPKSADIQRALDADMNVINPLEAKEAEFSVLE
jgi:recombination protein RecT